MLVCRCAAQCFVSGVTAPANGQLGAGCAPGASLDPGASCTLTCSAGFTLSGQQPSCSADSVFSAGSIRCTDTNECSTNNGGCAGQCANTPGSFSCSCGVGFSLNADGAACDDVDECAAVPCMNGAACADSTTPGSSIAAGVFQCTCVAGFEGSTCQNDKDECTSTPCENAGFCTDDFSVVGIDAYQCSCPPGWTGDNCATDINECAPDPCENGAACSTPVVNAYTCACVAGAPH